MIHLGRLDGWSLNRVLPSSFCTNALSTMRECTWHFLLNSQTEQISWVEWRRKANTISLIVVTSSMQSTKWCWCIVQNMLMRGACRARKKHRVLFSVELLVLAYGTIYINTRRLQSTAASCLWCAARTDHSSSIFERGNQLSSDGIFDLHWDTHTCFLVGFQSGHCLSISWIKCHWCHWTFGFCIVFV